MRHYTYQGRPELLARALSHPADPPILSLEDLDRMARQRRAEWTDDELAGTWVITSPDGLFRCGGRRREHVDVAGGADVFAAGEVWFGLDRRQKTWTVRRLTNRSIGYRIPLPSSYEAVRAAFARAGLTHASGAYDEIYVSANCPEHGLQILRVGEPLECKICFAPATPLHGDLA